MERYGLAAFRSRQSVMRFDDVLQHYGIRTHIVSTPHSISMGCGLSVRLETQDMEKAMELYRLYPEHNQIGFYDVLCDGQRIQVYPKRV